MLFDSFLFLLFFSFLLFFFLVCVFGAKKTRKKRLFSTVCPTNFKFYDRSGIQIQSKMSLSLPDDAIEGVQRSWQVSELRRAWWSWTEHESVLAPFPETEKEQNQNQNQNQKHLVPQQLRRTSVLSWLAGATRLPTRLCLIFVPTSPSPDPLAFWREEN